MMINDENNIHYYHELRNITIENCEFRNFFYEFGSLIQLPRISYDYMSTLLAEHFGSFHLIIPEEEISITLLKNTFNRINSCGSILSNYKFERINAEGLT